MPSHATPTRASAVAAAAAPRMTLDAIRRGRIVSPVRTLLYGVEGIGKSTFGANAPAPIFIGAEEGTGHLDVNRFPQPTSFIDVRDAIRTLTTQEHAFRTCVIDTVDWIEPLIWAHICERDSVANIEGYGYGKGYVAALDEWRVLVNDLELLRNAKDMAIVLLAHSWIKPFKNPEGDDFDRYEMKIHARAAGLLKEWSDVVLFSNYETFAAKDDKTKRVRGVSTDRRLLFTNRTAAYDAKNRYSLPSQIALDWADYAAAVAEGRVAQPVVMLAEIRRKAGLLGDEMTQKVEAAIVGHEEDTDYLARINNKLNVRLRERDEQEPKEGATA